MFDRGKEFPIYFGTNVAYSGCLFKVISASNVADLSISLLTFMYISSLVLATVIEEAVLKLPIHVLRIGESI